MTDLKDVQKPTQAVVLAAFSDLTGFTRFAKSKSDEELFATMGAG